MCAERNDAHTQCHHGGSCCLQQSTAVRTLRRVILCLGLGAITTIAVAWVIAAVRPIPMYPRGTLGVFEFWNRPWNVSERRGIGFHDVWWMDLNADAPGPTAELVRSGREQLDHRPPGSPPAGIRNSAPWFGTFHNAEPATLIGSDTAFGFPVPCLWYSVRGLSSPGSNTITSDQVEGGFMVRGAPSSRIRDFAAIPYRALWLPLVIDTFAFAAVWLVLLSWPKRVRRILRRRRNRCPNCNYSLLGLAPGSKCPECGR